MLKDYHKKYEIIETYTETDLSDVHKGYEIGNKAKFYILKEYKKEKLVEDPSLIVKIPF